MWSVYVDKFSPFWNTVLTSLKLNVSIFIVAVNYETSPWEFSSAKDLWHLIFNLLVCISEKLHEYDSEIFNILHAVYTRYDFVSEIANAFIKQTPAILRALFRIKTENLLAERDGSSNIEWICAEL
jgi:hypothetical protein